MIKADSLVNGDVVRGYTYKNSINDDSPIRRYDYYFVDTLVDGAKFITWEEASADGIKFTEVPGTRDTVLSWGDDWDTVYIRSTGINATVIMNVIQAIDSSTQNFNIKVDKIWDYIKD